MKRTCNSGVVSVGVRQMLFQPYTALAAVESELETFRAGGALPSRPPLARAREKAGTMKS